jgi:DNA-binding NarL/FixJ family response regulator
MNVRSDAPKAIQSVTSATAELLSTRERNVINLIACGESNKEVIHTPGISPETAKSHMKCMMVRRHVHPTKTRKDTLAADHFVEPLFITRTAAILRLA